MILKGLRDPVGDTLVGSALVLLGFGEGTPAGAFVGGLLTTGLGGFETMFIGGLTGLYLLIVGATVSETKVRPDRCSGVLSDGDKIESGLGLPLGALFSVVVIK